MPCTFNQSFINFFLPFHGIFFPFIHNCINSLWRFTYTHNFSGLRRLSLLFIRIKGHIRTKGQSSNKNDIFSKTFLFMGNMSPYHFKTIFRLCVECIPSFIKIGGAVSEKNGRTRQTFVVLYIGYLLCM